MSQPIDSKDDSQLLKAVWPRLTPDDQKAYWKYMYDWIPGDSGVRVTLSQMIGDLEAGPSRSRGPGALPPKRRKLGIEELRRGVKRFKERLFDVAERGGHCLTRPLHEVSRVAYLDDILIILDAFGVPHDEKGMREKGYAIQEPAPDTLEAIIGELSGKISPPRLAIALCALWCDSYSWAFLHPLALRLTAIDPPTEAETDDAQVTELAEPLQLDAPEDVEARTSVVEGGGQGSSEGNSAPDVGSRIEVLRAAFTDLKKLADRLSAALSAGLLPEVDDFGNSLHLACQEFGLLAALSEPPEISLAGIEAAYARRNANEHARGLVLRVQTIRNERYPEFPGGLRIREECDRALAIMKSGQIMQENLSAFRALATLVGRMQVLTSKEEDALDAEVERVFGNDVLRAVARGRLAFQEVPDEDPPGALAVAGDPPSRSAGIALIVTTRQESPTIDDVEAFAGAVQASPDKANPTDPQIPTPSAEKEQDSSRVEIAARSYQEVTEKLPAREASLLANAPAVSVPDPRKADEDPIDEYAISKVVHHGASTESKSRPDAAVAATELLDFKEFSDRYWIASDGEITSAPWREKEYATRLVAAGSEALERHDFALAFLFFLAVEKSGLRPPIAAAELGTISELLEKGPAAEGLSDPLRAQRFLTAYNERQQGPALRIMLFLEGLAPLIPGLLNPADFKRMCDFAHFHDRNLGGLVLGMLQERAAGGDVFGAIFLASEKERPTDAIELERDLDKFRKQLRAEVATMWSAAGGSLARTHCREAWKRFVDQEVVPLRDKVLPSREVSGDYKRWNINELEAMQRQFLANYRTIADEGEIGNADRKKADKAAAKLAELFRQVIQTAGRIHRHTSHQKAAFDKLSPDAVQALLSGQSLNDPVEELCRLVLVAICTKEISGTSPMRLSPSYLLACPDLMRFLPVPPQDLDDLAGKGVSASNLTDVIQAASCALTGIPGGAHVKPSEFGDSLRLLIMDRQRPELLSILAQSGKLDSALKSKLHREADALGARAFLASESLRSLWRDCEALIAPESHLIKRIAEEAQSLTSEHVHLQSVGATKLVLAWIESTVGRAESVRAMAIGKYETLIESRFPERLGEFQLARDTGDLRSIPPLTRDSVGKGGQSHGTTRRTIWRKAAEKFFEQPARYLNDRRPTQNEVGQSLLNLWLTRSYGGQNDHNRRLRHQFYFFVSGDPGADEKARKKANYPRELRNLENQRVTIDAQQIRKMFNKSRVNPTFIPQLKDFGSIIIVSAPAARTGSGVATWVRSVVEQNEANALLVMLAPGLPAELRAEVLGHLRQRKICAALIDDVDICRLVAMDHPAGHDFVPFLEIVLEQLALDLHNISPFSPVDGQNTPMEMFVGRQDMADALAYKAEITRVFSGRKLGKSAMLKHIEVKYDGTELPSGMKLNVVFISIPGIDSELAMVRRIQDELRRRFEVAGLTDDPSRQPAERFVDLVRGILDARPEDSILIILDEADTFIEAQLIEQQSRPEGTLSFRMMKELPSTVDKRGFPRVRVVFSGYRKTNTRDGVWANAGDILTLKPLQPEEASSFVEGALARIGVNVGPLAGYVASRCGFQPAVLIRFGAVLLSRLQRTRSASERESIAVTEEDVIETFNDAAVQSEIRTVVNNNFHSNPAGQAIFSATLLAMKDLAPGYMLENGAQQVLDKLRDVEGNADWLYRIDPDPKAEVERNLQDFIDRELLESDETRFEERTYRLRFPHFLPVLTQQADLPLQVKQAIASLRNAPLARGIGGCVLPKSLLEAVRHWYLQPTAEYCRLCVVAGVWPDALRSEKVGVANRLGIPHEGVVDCREARQYDSRLKAGDRLFSDPSTSQCDELHKKQWKRPAIVVGGMGALRRFTELQESQLDVPIEIAGTRRFTASIVAWWFETARALHFEAGNAIARLMDATCGSPYLTMKIDALFGHEGGSDVTSSELDQVLVEFENQQGDLIRGLASDDLLAPREWELLQMIGGLASLGLGTFDIKGGFVESWEIGADSLSASARFAPPYAKAEDPIGMRVLELAGMIGIRDESKGKRLVDEAADGFAARVFRHAGG